MSDTIRWGILGAARFALEHMGPAINAANGAELAALATSSPEKLAAFQRFAPNIRHHSSYDDLLNDPEIDAIYIPLPNHLHVDWSIKALEAGKPVLCEKPVGMSVAEVDKLIAARDKAGLLVAEAYMIVHHPQWQRARSLVQGGAIGALRHVNAVFSFCNEDLGNIRNQADTGGGGLRDIGVYTMGCCRVVTGQEPETLAYSRIQTDNGVDVFSDVGFDFPDFTFQSVTAIRIAPRQEVHFHGTDGVLSLSCPFNAGVFSQAELHLCTVSHRPEAGQGQQVMTERFPRVNHYVEQVQAFGHSLRNGTDYPWPLEQSRGTQAMLDTVLAQI